jgi:hypothetical protein
MCVCVRARVCVRVCVCVFVCAHLQNGLRALNPALANLDKETKSCTLQDQKPQAVHALFLGTHTSKTNGLFVSGFVDLCCLLKRGE